MEDGKWKPLSDITNSFGIVPTSTLIDLLSSNSNLSSFSKPKILTLRENASSANQRLCSGSSKRSDSSIGSSSVGALSNRRSVEFRDPPIELSSIKPQSGGRNKDSARSTRNLIEKTDKRKGNDVVIVNPQPTQARKSKGKASATPFSASPAEKLQANQIKILSENLTLNGGPIENSSSNRRSVKGKAVVDSLCSTDVSSRSYGKRNGTKNVVVESSSSSIMGSEQREKTKGKAVGILQASSRAETTRLESSSPSLAVNGGATKGKAEKRKKNYIIGSSSCAPLVKIRNEVKKCPRSWSDPRPNARKKRCSKMENTSALPQDFIEKQRAYFKEVDEFELEEEVTSKDGLE